MSEWIEINLLWRFQNQPMDEEFDKENRAWLERFHRERTENFGDLKGPDFSYEELQAIRDRAPEAILGPGKQWTLAYLERIESTYGYDPQVVALARHRYQYSQALEWENTQPWIQEWGDKVKRYREECDAMSFSHHPLCQPGVLIEVQSENGQETNYYLIGDINKEGGFCGDCSINPLDKVLRAKDLRAVIASAR